VENLSICYTERLAEAGAVASVGSKGDSYDNALAETISGLFKTEVIRKVRIPPKSNTHSRPSRTPQWSKPNGSERTTRVVPHHDKVFGFRSTFAVVSGFACALSLPSTRS